MKKIVFLTLTIAFFGFNCFSLCADEIPFQLVVRQRSVSLGSSVQLELTFTDSQSIPAPELPSSDAWQARYVGPSRFMSFTNGTMSQSVTHTYTVMPLKTGTLTIGPFRFNYKGNTYVSDKIEISVSDRGQLPQTQTGSSTTTDPAQAGFDDYVFLTMELDRKKAYVNEKVPLLIKLYVNRFAVQDVNYPTLQHEGFSVDEYGKPKQYQQIVGGVRYDIVEFSTTVYGTRSGVFQLGPAEMSCNLLMKKQNKTKRTSSFDDFFGDDFFDSFFGRYERQPLSLNSPSATFEVLPLPEEGKPADFSGTLGRFDFDVSVGPKTLSVGDPITLKMSITGQGNFDTVQAPRLAATEGFKVYDPDVKMTDGSKTFEQIIMPTDATVTEVPALEFSFFDTRSGTYKTVRKGPFPITVQEAEGGKLQIVEMPDKSSKPVLREVLGRDIIYVKQTPGRMRRIGSYMYAKASFISSQGAMLIGFIGFAFYADRKKRLETDIQYRRRFHAPRKAKKGIQKARSLLDKNAVDFYDAVFKTLQEYLGDLFHLPSGGITTDIVDSELRQRAIPDDILDALKTIFSDCDMVRYAPSEFDLAKMQKTFDEFTRVIDYLERHR
jgi:hypothetical protein